MGWPSFGIESAVSRLVRLTVFASAALLAWTSALCAEEKKPSPCTEDAVIVFDASGSMSGN